MTGKSSLLNSAWVAKHLPNPEGWIKVKQAPPPPPLAGSNFRTVPEVELSTLEGQPFRLSDLRGRVVLLNFWATWCMPCRAEIPEFNAMQRELKAQGLERSDEHASELQS